MHTISGSFSDWFSSQLLKAFSQPISLACCQLSADWKHTFYVCLRCRSWQQVLGKWNHQQWVFIGIRDPELKSTVFWVVLAVSKISNQFSVHSVWHSDRCSRRMFHHVLCQEPEALQWWLAAGRLTAVTGCGWLISVYRNLYTMGGLFIENLLLDIFQLMSFFYCINWFSFFSVSVTVSVIFYFSVTVILVTVNLIIFSSYFAISVTVTVNLNNTGHEYMKGDRRNSEHVHLLKTVFI